MRIKKIELKIAENAKIEEEKDYRYVFSNSVDFEEAKRRGLTNPYGGKHIIILEE